MTSTSRRIKRKANDRAAERLLEYCWVIALSRFVKIDDALNPSHSYTPEQFDEAFAPLEPLSGCAPSVYLRVNNKHHRVVDRMDMIPSEADKIVPLPDEWPLIALNLAAPIPEPAIPNDPFPEIFMEHIK